MVLITFCYFHSGERFITKQTDNKKKKKIKKVEQKLLGWGKFWLLCTIKPTFLSRKSHIKGRCEEMLEIHILKEDARDAIYM